MTMHGRGNERPGLVAKCVFVLIGVVGLAMLAVGIFAMRNESTPVRGSQVLPAQAAEQAGQMPRAAPQPN